MRPGKIVCVGQNYHAHIRELNSQIPQEPVLFLKPSTALVGDGDDILIPRGLGRVDYEGELAAIIGRRASRVSVDEALEYVDSLAAFNDVTARDVQSRARKAGLPWSLAKGIDTFAPLSPPFPLKKVPDVKALIVETRLNGELRQRGRVADMIFSLEELIAFISSYMTLEKGDVVATGTPEGVGPLRDGDVVEVTIAGVARVRNTVKSI